MHTPCLCCSWCHTFTSAGVPFGFSEALDLQQRPVGQQRSGSALRSSWPSPLWSPNGKGWGLEAWPLSPEEPLAWVTEQAPLSGLREHQAAERFHQGLEATEQTQCGEKRPSGCLGPGIWWLQAQCSPKMVSEEDRRLCGKGKCPPVSNRLWAVACSVWACEWASVRVIVVSVFS